MKSKFIAILVISLLIVTLGATFYFTNGFTQSVVGSTSIWTVEYGRLECQEDSQQSAITKWVDQDYTFVCGENYLVDGCSVYLTCGDTSFLSPVCDGGYRINNGNWIYYKVQEGQRGLITNLKPNEKINFAQKTVTNSGGIILPRNEDKSKVDYEFNPYRLYTYESGGKFISSSSDCCLANQNELQKNQFKAGEWSCLSTSGSNQFRNYFLDWKLTSGAKVYTYNNQNAICKTNALYELETENLADGSQRIIQGDKIKNVECCPHQTQNCDSKTFNFIKEAETETRECTFNYQCENSGNPYGASGTTYKVQTCSSGKCVITTKTAECTTDQTCRNIYGDNYGCDLSLDNYGKCIKIGQIEQEYCGNGYCDGGETFQTCPSDCSIVDNSTQLQCGFFKDLKETESCKGNPLCWAGVVEPKPVNKCVLSTWVYLLFGVLALGIITTVTYFKYRK